MNLLTIIEGYLDQIVPADVARSIELRDDQPSVFTNAVTPEALSRFMASGHLFKGRRTAVNQGHTRIPAKTSCIRAFSQADRQDASRNSKVLHRACQGE